MPAGRRAAGVAVCVGRLSSLTGPSIPSACGAAVRLQCRRRAASTLIATRLAVVATSFAIAGLVRTAVLIVPSAAWRPSGPAPWADRSRSGLPSVAMPPTCVGVVGRVRSPERRPAAHRAGRSDVRRRPLRRRAGRRGARRRRAGRRSAGRGLRLPAPAWRESTESARAARRPEPPGRRRCVRARRGWRPAATGRERTKSSDGTTMAKRWFIRACSGVWSAQSLTTLSALPALVHDAIARSAPGG